MNRRILSELRRELNQLLQERAACEQVAQGRTEMARGSYIERKMPPSGNIGRYLGLSIDGQAQQRYIPKAEAEVWRKRCERWGEFHRAIAKWTKLNKRINRILREMGRERCVPIPPKKTESRKRRARASKKK